MSINDFRVLEAVGKGSFASVYKVVRKSDNKVYALKRAKIGKMSKKEISDALNEIRFLASIRHDNIVGFLEAFLEENDTELCIVMEYCASGDLAGKVERYKKRRELIEEDVIWRYLIQCLKALQHLHEKGICHRDLKTSNCFLTESGAVKVGDMNVSKRLKGGQLQTQIGTPYYMSPEIWNNRPYDFSSDMWALGCMIYELCALRPPFLGDSFPALKRAVTAGRFPPIPRKYSEPLHRVINALIRVNARERPSADVLLRSPELASKLHLDDGSTAFGQNPNQGKNEKQNLLETIKVPSNMKMLSTALPKPCYPDVRPNSPSAWTAAEQKQKMSRVNIENVEQRRPGAALRDGPQLPQIDEDRAKEGFSVAALRKELGYAKEGLPPPSERAPLKPLVTPANNGVAVVEKSRPAVGGALPPARGGAVNGIAGYKQRQENAKVQQPSGVGAVKGRAQYVPHRMW